MLNKVRTKTNNTEGIVYRVCCSPNGAVMQ